MHHTEATVDETFVVEVAEHLDDALAARFVHGESGSVPIARSTEFLKLLEDNYSMLVSPGPCMLKELLSGEIRLLDAFLSQFVHHLCLSGNRCVVGTRHPEGVLALHTCTAHKDILDSIVKHMAHMQHTGYIRRRDNNSVRLT